MSNQDLTPEQRRKQIAATFGYGSYNEIEKSWTESQNIEKGGPGSGRHDAYKADMNAAYKKHRGFAGDKGFKKLQEKKTELQQKHSLTDDEVRSIHKMHDFDEHYWNNK